ncbi:tRNA(His) guanylyltransferase Thg1 family protein [uncultured Arcobacter sp.]|uniref:tRNA(His) guanylyltransferase Thg1 family protein n=1 Tax=uncultured Arcobacter sp. TaxID=165434 RepID=UPI002624E6A9|nr:tRNA(His) guanylyltransferase Thg1 family protein [uncultured Arcobacter sp.]
MSKSYDKDPIGQRMKQYEHVYTSDCVEKKTPVVIRIDGKAFHTYTKGFEYPFDEDITYAMDKTTEYLVKNVQNCCIGYTQSDEISLILLDDKNEHSEQMFGNKIQKLASVTASMATAIFNQVIKDRTSTTKLAMFDSRIFNVPKEDLGNYMLWIHRDCIKNSVSMYARTVYSHKELYKQGKADMIEMIETAFNEGRCDRTWHNLPYRFRYGIVMTSKDGRHFPKEDWTYYTWNNVINQYYED